MNIFKVYEIGRALNYAPGIQKDEEKLRDIYFEYTSREINSTVGLVFMTVVFLYLLVSEFSGTLGLVIFFLGSITAVLTYIYPTNIYYSQVVMEYNEQMFKAILSLSNYVSMKTSLEYAFYHSAGMLRGVLKIEFNEIINKMQRKEKNSLGEAFEDYIPKWNRYNLTFVKSLRLLQTALMAEDKEMDVIIKETIETLMINFKIRGKRSAEQLANKSKSLIAFGVLLPVMSLMLLPLLSIFMADVVQAGMMFFIYNVLFPTIMLLLALDFANKRVQIDTINLEESPHYKEMPAWIFMVAIALIFFLAIPGVAHLTSIDMTTEGAAEQEYQFISIFSIWLISLGLAAAVFVVAKYYTYLHRKEWEDIKAAEDDMPHLLQIFSTFLSLNISIENILPSIEKDYKEQGFSDHPIVRIFSELSRKMMFIKGDIGDLIVRTLNDICPSKKVTNMLSQITSFANVSQESATKAAKLIRSQTIATIELDDYIRTLLAETTGLINIAVTMLLPLLSGVAVIMSILIVKALDFISAELASIQKSFSGGDVAQLNLIDITQIIPPTMLEVIVIIYFLEMFFILSLFSTKIEIGNDKFKLAEKLVSNLVGYVIFTCVLLLGHFVMIELFFRGILG